MTVTAPASKSQAIRLILAAALGNDPVRIENVTFSDDVNAMIDCVKALGASVRTGAKDLTVCPGTVPAGEIVFPCRESAAVLRLLLAVAGAKGLHARFLRAETLAVRPIEPYRTLLASHGSEISEDGNDLTVSGFLTPGDYVLDGCVSSQFASGLLMALPLLKKDSTLKVLFPIASRPYIRMTVQTLCLAGQHHSEELPDDGIQFLVRTDRPYQLPERVKVEGDWSAAAVFLARGAVSDEGVTVRGLTPDSLQGDRKFTELLRTIGAEVTVTEDAVTVRKGTLRAFRKDFFDMPDLVPVSAVLAAVSEGETVITGASRLRTKETDRLKGTAELIQALGGEAYETEDGLRIVGKPALSGGDAPDIRDHRIVMAEALAGCVSGSPIRIACPEAVNKSYPGFFEDWNSAERTSR